MASSGGNSRLVLEQIYNSRPKYITRTASKRFEIRRTPREAIRELLTCEGVFVASYRGYEAADGMPSWYKPPKALFRIEEFLKGPPIGSGSLPTKFEFHDTSKGAAKPGDWKFDENMMPLKNSRWLIGIPNCVPADGMFETYHGSAGRIEATEENVKFFINELDRQKINPLR